MRERLERRIEKQQGSREDKEIKTRVKRRKARKGERMNYCPFIIIMIMSMIMIL